MRSSIYTKPFYSIALSFAFVKVFKDNLTRFCRWCSLYSTPFWGGNQSNVPLFTVFFLSDVFFLSIDYLLWVHDEPGDSPSSGQTIPLVKMLLFQTLISIACISSVRTLLSYPFDISTFDQDVDGSLYGRNVYLALLRDSPV